MVCYKTYQSDRAHRVLMNPFLDHLHCREEELSLAPALMCGFKLLCVPSSGDEDVKCTENQTGMVNVGETVSGQL